MEPRELWERHAVLAQAFCSSDDEVRRTQGLLDEAEVRRSRTLAAFAVTVGSDAVVADLLGLDEREVRLARRTVGKEDARAVAKSLLSQPAPPREQPPVPEQPPAQEPPAAQQAAAHPTAPGHPAAGQPVAPGHPAGQPVAPGQPAAPGQVPAGHATAPTPTPAAAPPPAAAAQVTEPTWAPALDAVLMSSWHTGVDLTALATELGLDVRFLVARAQQLSADGRQTAPPAPPQDRLGRHRRMATLPPTQQHDTAHLPWRERPSQPQYEHEAWRQQSYPSYQNHTDYRSHQEYQGYQDYQAYDGQQQHSAPTWDASAITTAQHDWDGILSQWEATTPTPAPGHGGA
ncbi:hypothetical protein ACWD6P_16910 [Streptomyces sp. NPDC002446]